MYTHNAIITSTVLCYCVTLVTNVNVVFEEYQLSIGSIALSRHGGDILARERNTTS